MKYADLFSTLTLVDIDIGQWDGTVSLSAEDLGLPNTEAVKKTLELGRRRLIDRKYLQPIAQPLYKARRLLDTKGLKVPLFTGTRAIANDQLGEVLAQLNLLHDDMEAGKRIFEAQYQLALQEMQPFIEKACTDAGVEDPAKAAWRAIYYAPPIDTVLRKAYLTWRTFALSAPIDEALQTNESEDVAFLTRQIVAELRLELKNALSALTRGGERGVNIRTVEAASRAIARAREKNILDDPIVKEVIQLLDPILRGMETMQPQERVGAAKGSVELATAKLTEAVNVDVLSFGKRRMTKMAPS